MSVVMVGYGVYMCRDTFWIIHGLLVCNMTETVANMLLNFNYLVDRYRQVQSVGYRWCVLCLLYVHIGMAWFQMVDVSITANEVSLLS